MENDNRVARARQAERDRPKTPRREPKDWTPSELVAAWDAGETFFTAEMGGIGPGYEQSIQVLMIEVLRDNIGKELPADDSSDVEDWGRETAKRCGAELGLSGAQAGAGISLAFRILKFGYGAMLDSIQNHDNDRLIQVSNRWPMLSRDDVGEPSPIEQADRVADVGVTVDLLLMSGTIRPQGDEEQEEFDRLYKALVGVVSGWTQEQREAACDWAGAVHLSASDNDDVVVPETPAHVAALQATRRPA